VTSPTRQPGKYERLCLERHERDLSLCRRPGGHPRGLWFDEAAAERPVRFVEDYCTHHKGEWAGKPLLLQDWQKAIIRQAFGWMRADGTRRFRTLYWELPRKQGKSTIAAGLGLYLTMGDREPGAEVYASATKKDQARIVWDEAARTVRKSPKLQRHARAFRNSLHCERLGSKFEPLGADSNTLDGLNPHGNIVDELHAHRDRGVWDVLDTAMGARRQPVTLAITTAGTYAPESIGWQIHDYACKVLEGVYDDDASNAFHAFIAAADEPPKGQEGYYFTEAAQRQANPGYGVSLKPSYLAEQAEKAKQQPHFTNEYLRLHLNVWTQQTTRWLSLERWNESDPAPNGLSGRAWAIEREAALAGQKCWGGLDLSSRWDLSALVLAFPGDGDEVSLIARFWLPEGTVEKYARKGQRHYAQWAQEGWLTTTPGDVVDYEFIRAEVHALAKRYAIQDIAFDRWGAQDVANRLAGDGAQLVEYGQGHRSMSEPSKDLEARVISRKVRHAGNPVLRFCVANAVVTTDSAGNIKPDKSKAADRIDGVVATVMALGRIIASTGDDGPSVYEERGIRTL
jgi:phage terminase large subunit-like protein